MTTRIMVEASGPCYPARVIKRNKDGSINEEYLVPSDFRYTTWLASEETIEVTEEYHPDGYNPLGVC